MLIYNFPGKRNVRPSYATENARLAPVIAQARKLDIATNPAPEAIFEAGSAGFQIWCTPENHPGGLWAQIKMSKGAFSKPCAYLASVCWKWGEDKDAERIVGVELSTTAYALRDAGLLPDASIQNRRPDLEWAKAQIKKLFDEAQAPLPPFFVDNN